MGIGGKKTLMGILASRSQTTRVFVRPGHRPVEKTRTNSRLSFFINSHATVVLV